MCLKLKSIFIVTMPVVYAYKLCYLHPDIPVYFVGKSCLLIVTLWVVS